MSVKENAIAFLEHFLPKKIHQLIILNTLIVENTQFYDKDLRDTYCDILYRVNIAGNTGFILLVLEHQSQADKLMPLRHIKYKIAAAQKVMENTKSKYLPVIYSMTFYHDPNNRPYPYSTDIYDLFGEHAQLAKEFFFTPFQLIDVNQLDDEKLIVLEQFGTMAYLMKYGRSKADIKEHIEYLAPELKKLDKEATGRHHINNLLSYMLWVSSSKDPMALAQYLANDLSKKTRGNVMSMATQLIAQGKREGRREGEHNMARCLLESRFGALSPEHLRRLQAFSQDELLALPQQIFTFESINEAFE